MNLATPSRAPTGLLATFWKILGGVVVFAAIVGGWTAAQHYQRMHQPLPDAGGRQGRCVLWFVGSSSIARWKTLAADMAPWITHNRGVGGAFLPELRQRFANEADPVSPDAIIFYGGDNDIAKGQSAADTADQFRQFVAAKMTKMPDVPMLAIGVKPSPTRWAMRGTQLEFDRAVNQTAAHTPHLTFLDASTGLLINGRPGPFFEPDGIHLSTAGYRVWAGVVHKALVKMLPPDTVTKCKHEVTNM
jgi:lysophospholipase L1-like esterase